MARSSIKSVAVIGAGAAGAITAVALEAEGAFDVIRVFERREVPGGTWIYDPNPKIVNNVFPGKLPPDIDPPLDIPETLPQTVGPSTQNRFDTTPIYRDLTTNVPEIGMSFSDQRFPYGPFVPHWIARQYIENYFSWHKVYSSLVLSTTVEELSRVPSRSSQSLDRWKLSLRRFDQALQKDVWWEEDFDAVVMANGHYSVPFTPSVQGLEEYMSQFPGRISHSKSFRTPEAYSDQRVVVIGNSASGLDITKLLLESGKPKLPIYQSRRSKSRFEGEEPAEGVVWMPVIKEYRASTGEILFGDGTSLTDVDAVIYCTGYRASFPFWNAKKNGGPIFDYEQNRVLGNYQHTFVRQYPQTLGIVGIPRVLTFRSFEYQAIALARLFAGRNATPLPSAAEQKRWEEERAELVRRERRKFHDIPMKTGEDLDWFRILFRFSGLPTVEGSGLCPPVLNEKTRWALKHVRKYPLPKEEQDEKFRAEVKKVEDDWVQVEVPKL